jgi:hypothetical protein
MPKVSSQTLREVEQALEAYEAEVRAARLAPKTVRTYLLHATNFVRWMRDDFAPGERNQGA